jgi:SNF2 family DNA or RNA helicase
MASPLSGIVFDMNGHQRRDVYWLLQHPWGKILANDMGLGTTIVGLAYIFALQTWKNDVRYALVVVPKLLLRNWYEE